MMDEAAFWKFMDDSRTAVEEQCDNGDEFQEQQMDHLEAALTKAGPETLRQFELRFLELCDRAYRWDIWGAAYWEGGGCGNDGFLDFRSNLVSLGKKMYEQVLRNPDNLADIIGRPDVPTMQGEGFGYIATKLYSQITGKDMNLDEYRGPKKQPDGTKWNFDDKEETAKRLPRLVKKLPSMGG
jgi:hypothetical protein